MDVLDEFGPELTPEQWDLLRRWHASRVTAELFALALALRLNYESELQLLRPRTLTDRRVSPEALQLFHIMEWDIQWPKQS